MSIWRRLFGDKGVRKGRRETESKSSVSEPGPVGSTPKGRRSSELDEQLLSALDEFRLDEVKSLLTAGANPNAARQFEAPVYKPFRMETFREPAIHMLLGDMIRGEHRAFLKPMLELLLSAGADINARDKRNENWTPLMHAAYNKHTELVNLLLERGADTTLRDEKGRTAFRLIQSKDSWDYNEILAILASATADGRHWLASEDGIDWKRANTVDERAPVPVIRANTSSVLQDALRKGLGSDLDQIFAWVEAGGDLNWTDTNGWTLLHLAAQCGNTQVVQLLLNRGANLEATDKQGNTPIMLACDVENSPRLNMETISMLLDRGANPNAKNRSGKTALALIRRSGSAEAEKIAQVLIDWGARTTPGLDSPCPECGAPYSAEMSKRDVRVTFEGAFGEFGCLECGKSLRAPLEAIGRTTGVQVKCSCGAIAMVPPSVWCKTCGNGLSTNWQQVLTRVM